MMTEAEIATPASVAATAARRIPAVRAVPFDAPWNWLAAGWRDLWSAPQVGLCYGAAVTLVAYGFVFLLFRFELLPLILPLAGGFLLVGPLIAVGLYEVSRRLARGQEVSVAASVAAALQPNGQIALIGVALLIVFFAWVELALLLFMLFFGPVAMPPLELFVPALLFSAAGLGLLVTGTAIGGLFAAFVFAMSAISIPMLLDRDVDAMSAVIVSLRSVIANPKAMALWAALIAGLTVLGAITLFAGLVIAFPLVAHATWHAYRDLTGERGP